LGFSKASLRRASTLIHKLIARFSQLTLQAPALLPASSLQLALNLFNFRCIACGQCELAGEDYEQHVNECVSRDVHQFSEHHVPPWIDLEFELCIRNPAARSGQL
jgi:hypothetical protein